MSKFEKLKPLVFSINDLAFIDESAVVKNFDNPHDHAVYKATEVDKFIAEKDAEIAQWKEKFHDLDNSWNEQTKEIAELRMKRCDQCQQEISQRDAEIAQLQAMLEERNKQVGELKHSLELASNECCSICERDVKKIRHHKYKRCLARWLYLRECYWRCLNHNEPTKADWYLKWMNIFQKLAEHYSVTDNKNAKTPEYGKRNCKNCLQCHELEDKDTFYKVFCTQAGHWMEWNKEYNCTQFLPKDEK